MHEAVLEDLPELADYDVYMSGPPAMIDACRRRFVGRPAEARLYYDSFDYAPDVLAQILPTIAGIRPVTARAAAPGPPAARSAPPQPATPDALRACAHPEEPA